jgi:hypothetical protein
MLPCTIPKICTSRGARAHAFRLRQGGNNRFISFAIAASPQWQTKKLLFTKHPQKQAISLLPQAKNDPCGLSKHAIT